MNDRIGIDKVEKEAANDKHQDNIADSVRKRGEPEF
jgi:hypothetical protein